VACAASIGSARVITPHVRAELIAERDAVVPGQPFTVGLRLQHIPHWHTYWRNPGDSGAATAIAWRLPEGFSAGEIQWPYPKRLPVGPLTNFGYEDRVLLITEIAAPAKLTTESVTIYARANWLVCSDVCIPESAELSLALPVALVAHSVSAVAEEFARTQERVPVPIEGWRFSAKADGDHAVLSIEPPAGSAPLLAELAYFPYAEGQIEHSAPQRFARQANGYSLAIARAVQPVGPFDRVHGILVAEQRFGAGGPRAITVDVPVVGKVAASTSTAIETASAPVAAARIGLALAIGLAFVGGTLLNFMPCVFPILSIKVMGVMQHDTAAQARRYGLAYGLGVVVSFLLLGALLFALRALGQPLGWGFQLQSPVFVAVLALLFFLLGLNLSGAFEFGHVLPQRLVSFRMRNRSLDAALSGLLAVVAASPCTAPFMGAALGYAAAQSAGEGSLVFAALGIGMAAPFVLLAHSARARRRLPRPGAWMQTLKEFLAFPLYATVIWLAWVLGRQAGLGAVVSLFAALLVLGFSVWLLGRAQRAQRRVRLIAAALGLIASVVLAVQPGLNPPAMQARAEEASWGTWSQAMVESELARGSFVFVDFTAAWCITCQLNKRLVLDRKDVMTAFQARGVTLLRADWTRHDPQITRALERLERKGVPVYVLYRPGQAPKLLPEVLTKEIVLQALGAA
jgi:thiol:disulfide interchange protein DsbD